MLESGHSRPDRASGKPRHVRYALIATKFCNATRCREVPKLEVTELTRSPGPRGREKPTSQPIGDARVTERKPIRYGAIHRRARLQG